MITKLTVALLGVLMLFAPMPSAEPWPRWGGPSARSPTRTTCMPTGSFGDDQSLLSMGYRVCGLLSTSADAG